VAPHVAILFVGWLVSLVLCPVNLGLMLLTLRSKTAVLAHGGVFILSIGLASFLTHYASSRDHDLGGPPESPAYVMGYSIPVLVIGQFVALLRNYLRQKRRDRESAESAGP